MNSLPSLKFRDLNMNKINFWIKKKISKNKRTIKEVNGEYVD
jgi:hypothetical protein